jgi:hypothetical protein
MNTVHQGLAACPKSWRLTYDFHSIKCALSFTHLRRRLLHHQSGLQGPCVRANYSRRSTLQRMPTILGGWSPTRKLLWNEVWEIR